MVCADCGAAALAAASGAAPLGLGRQAFAGEKARADQVVIYHTNDVHGHLQSDGSSAVGIDYVAGLHASTPNSLLVDAGDATQGMPVVSLSKGASAIELMERCRLRRHVPGQAGVSVPTRGYVQRPLKGPCPGFSSRRPGHGRSLRV